MAVSGGDSSATGRQLLIQQSTLDRAVSQLRALDDNEAVLRLRERRT
jgi:hypothetical protein